MYTVDRINRIRLTLGMTQLACFVKPMTANDDVRALEVFCGIHPWVEVNVYKRAVHDYVGKRLERLEEHVGLLLTTSGYVSAKSPVYVMSQPLDEQTCGRPKARHAMFCYNCSRLTTDTTRSKCDRCRAIGAFELRSRAGADLSGAHTFWLGAEAERLG